MGLPIFVVPTEPDAASKAAEKVTSGPRSSIRRQRTVRGPHARLAAETRRRRMLGLVTGFNGNGDYEVWEGQRTSPPHESGIPPVASSQAPGPRMFDDERMRLRDTLSFERQHTTNMEADGPLLPPAPESRDYHPVALSPEAQREVLRIHEIRRNLQRLARRRTAPTPPYTETDIALIARVGTDSPRPASLTPTLSPSRQLTLQDLEASMTFGRPSLERHDFTVREAPNTSDRSARPTLSERIQALTRVSSHFERSRRFLRQQRLDGLGDRDRSLSPDGVNAWDTLLTSITPDPQPPSAGSSFASASAAAAAVSGSADSDPGPASPSIPSLAPVDDPSALRDCDISDSGSNTEEEEEDIFELHGANLGTMRIIRPFRLSWADVATARPGRTSTEDTEHLGGMQRIISRLAERDDIPEEWWRMAGLRREPTS